MPIVGYCDPRILSEGSGWDLHAKLLMMAGILECIVEKRTGHETKVALHNSSMNSGQGSVILLGSESDILLRDFGL